MHSTLSILAILNEITHTHAHTQPQLFTRAPAHTSQDTHLKGSINFLEEIRFYHLKLATEIA